MVIKVNFSIKVIFILAFILSSSAAHADKCERLSNKLADDLIERLDEVTADLEADLNKVKATYMKKSPQAKEAHFDVFLAKQKEFIEYDSLYEKMYTAFPKVLRNISKNEKDRVHCDDPDKVEEFVDTRFEYFEQMTEKLLQGVEDRTELEWLDEDEGLVVIAAYSYGYAEKIQLKSKGWGGDSFDLGPLNNSQWFEVIKLSAGEYYWHRVIEKIYNGRQYFDLSDSDMSFNVEAGKINLSGAFIFERSNDHATWDISDRTAIILKILAENYPLLIDRFEWVNGLSPNDPFPSFFKAKRNQYEQDKEK